MHISISEISESLNRSRLANLIDHTKKRVNRQNLLEFLEFGVRYVFPQAPGAMVRGVPTAHSHPKMKQIFTGEMDYVWPDINGTSMGLMVAPFYMRQVEAVKEDPQFYKLLALVDLIRVGRVREANYAKTELKKSLYESPKEYFAD
jgi:hypothetical protein